MDAELWFTQDPSGQRYAASWCSVCPLLVECRALGRTFHSSHGVWGGESPSQRRHVGCAPLQ
ncbi:WhiB family transcriptional regulator [Kitasatospora sp. NBC_00070]|uniref:WhiB family transcriptional regulator n=1 Tax=Kitasatospora sp. NBC_00070 TaxID=2975962 RepID=UPI003860125B